MITKLVQIYKIADVFVMPSIVETFGIVLIEAMASGLPIISTSSPGCIDVIENGKYGYMIPVSDKFALSKAMQLFLKDRTLRESYSKLSSEASKKYGWDYIVNQYIRLYEKLIFLRSN